METNHNQIVSLIWNIADDVLREELESIYAIPEFRLADYGFCHNADNQFEEYEPDIRLLDAESQGFIRSLFENL